MTHVGSKSKQYPPILQTIFDGARDHAYVRVHTAFFEWLCGRIFESPSFPTLNSHAILPIIATRPKHPNLTMKFSFAIGSLLAAQALAFAPTTFTPRQSVSTSA